MRILRQAWVVPLLAVLTAVAAAPAASAASQPKTVRHIASVIRLPNGETITRLPHGVTLYTAPMRFASAKPFNGKQASAIPQGYGQNPGDCGTAKLWTYASSWQFQLSLIGNPGVFLGLGAYEMNTNGIGQITTWGAILGQGQTWTSGRVGHEPGLFSNAAAVAGDDQTSEGNCIIAVGAVWN